MNQSNVKEVPRPILQKRRPKVNRETKKIIVFDEDARREYLTGFQKRKNERRLKAKLENKQKEKEQKKAIKDRMRDMIQKAADRHRIPEVEAFLESTVYDDSEHTVTITDLSNNKPVTSVESDTEQQEETQDSAGVEADKQEEDPDALKKKKKKLAHKLANVGNISSKRKVKRSGKGKFKGGSGKQKGGSKKKGHNKKQRHK